MGAEYFGDRVRRLREAKGWTIPRAYAETGVAIGTWTNVETRGTDPRLGTVQKIADGLGVDIRELVTAPVFPPDDPALPADPPPDIADAGHSSPRRSRRDGRRGI